MQELPVDPLFQLLQLERRTAVVDIGANPIDGEPPYKRMLEKGLCSVVGFDPQKSAMELLERQTSPLQRYLPYAVGDGTAQTLHICSAPGMTSCLMPDQTTLSLFQLFPGFGEVVSIEAIQTRTLDSITEIVDLDFLKIDVQGLELSVFQSGKNKLSAAVAIQTEVSFLPLYENQPTLGIVDQELRSQGFIPHAMAELKKWILAPMMLDQNPRRPLNQLLEADLVYVRDFRDTDSFSDMQLKQLSLIAHYCYGSFDLAIRCIIALEQRNSLPADTQQRYVQLLQKK